MVRVLLYMIDHSYLSPPSRVSKIKLQPNYIYQNLNGKHIRRIFTRPHYEPFEKEAIDKLKDYLKKKAPNVYHPDQLLLRLNYEGNFLLSEVTQKLKLYEDWHKNEVITNLNKFSRDILMDGHIYAFGRDYQYCPIIYVKPNKINLKTNKFEDYMSATANILDALEKYMLVGGVVEKWTIIVDFQAKKFGLGMELVKKFIDKVRWAYPYRLKRLLFINTVPQNKIFIQEISSIIAQMDSQATTETIPNLQELQRYIRSDELEVKYGGNHFNIIQYWPIHSTNKHDETQSEQASQTEYKSAANDPLFFEQPKPPLCDLKSCSIY